MASHFRNRLPSAVDWSHRCLERFVRLGDVAVDATLGNGSDTLFLAALTGVDGHVYGFDTQSRAISATQRHLEENGITTRQFTLFQQSHHRMASAVPEHVHGKISAVTFNLGYLPGGDKQHITCKETTLPALDCALSLVKVGGVVSVITYPGHPGGEEESEAVHVWMAALDPALHEVQQWRAINRVAQAPDLCLVMRLR